MYLGPHAYAGLGASPPMPDAWTTPIDQLLANPDWQSKIPAARLYAVAVNELAKPDVRSQMSIFGDLSADVLISATRMAAEQVLGQKVPSPASLLAAGKDAITAIYNALPASTGAVMDALTGIVGQTATDVGTAIGEAIPIIGAFIGYVTAIEDFYAAQSQAQKELAAVVCQQTYRRPVATRAAIYGGMTPADLMHASQGDIFSAMESASPEGAYKASREPLTAEIIKNAVKAYGFLHGPMKLGVYIPAATRRLLRIMRLAIQNSWNDPESDAGVSLWPAYVDLVHSQFRQGHMSRGWASFIFDNEVLPANRNIATLREERPNTDIPEHQRSRMHLHKSKAVNIPSDQYADIYREAPSPLRPGGFTYQFSNGTWLSARGRCILHERRAFEEFMAQIDEWELVIHPTYKMDQAKAAELRATIDQIVRSISAAPLSKLGKISLQRTPVPRGQRAALALRTLNRSSALRPKPTTPFWALLTGAAAAAAVIWVATPSPR